MIVDLAREVVAELAPDELGLFPERCQAYFRKWKMQGRDPLGMGLDAWTSVATFAVLGTVQSVLMFIVVEFKKGVEEEGSSTIRAWIKRGFRKLGPADSELSESTPNIVETVKDDAAKICDEPLIGSFTREQLARVRKHAYEQAISFRMASDSAGKMADIIVARLTLQNPEDD